MATLSEIMTQEKKRLKEEDMRVINLYQEGTMGLNNCFNQCASTYGYR